MSDPVTIGTLGVLALNMAGEALIKGAAGEAVKDAYGHIKGLLKRHAKSDLEALEAQPTSKARQAVMVEVIDALPINEHQEIKGLFEQLTLALQSANSKSPIGIDIDKLSAINLNLQSVEVKSGKGGRFGEVTLAGDMTVGSLIVGDSTGKTPQ